MTTLEAMASGCMVAGYSRRGRREADMRDRAQWFLGGRKTIWRGCVDQLARAVQLAIDAARPTHAMRGGRQAHGS